MTERRSRDTTQRTGGKQTTAAGPFIEQTDLNRPTRFLSDMRFRVDLPEVVCDMKSLVTPFDATEVSKFELTHEEKHVPVDIQLPEFLGFEFGSSAAKQYFYDVRSPSSEDAELSDPDSLDTSPSLDDFDYEILDAVESVSREKLKLKPETMLLAPYKRKRLPVSVKNVDPERWWISENGAEPKQQQIQAPRMLQRSRKRKVRTFATKEAFLKSVKKGFEKAKNPPGSRVAQLTSSFHGGERRTSQTKTRKAVAVYDVMPYRDDGGRSFCTVNLHNSCVDDSDRLIPHGDAHGTQISENVLLKELYVEPQSKQEAEVNRAIGFDNKYLGLIAPCRVRKSADRRDSEIGREEDYLWIREYFYRKRKGEEVGKWKWALRLDKDRGIAEMVPIDQRFITQKQKLRSVIPRPISVKVVNTSVSEDFDIYN